MEMPLLYLVHSTYQRAMPYSRQHSPQCSAPESPQHPAIDSARNPQDGGDTVFLQDDRLHSVLEIKY